MRKLASIQEIRQLEAIPNVDRIEKATVLGWELVVKKGEFKRGDLCVYCEPDSILPEWDEFAFLGDNKRISTKKMRGQISQGIAFPIPLLEKYIACVKEGVDLTLALQIKKYEPYGTTGKYPSKGTFPFYIPRTDETRIQVIPQLLERHKNTLFYISEKLDGSSATFYLKDETYGFCSRVRELKLGHGSVWERINSIYHIERYLRQLGQNIGVQGEIIGPKLHSNKYKQNKQQLYLFDIFYIDEKRYAKLDELEEFSKKTNIPTVPILSRDITLPTTIKELEQMAEGTSKIYNTKREGIVCRGMSKSIDEGLKQFSDYGRLSFKVINKQFLLKHNK
jgi:RNA ligase (TIGR02306 family)